MQIRIQEVVKPNRTSYNVRIINGRRNFLCNNLPSRDRAEKYAAGLALTLTITWRHEDEDESA